MFKVLGDVNRNQLFSKETLNALGIIRYCALTIIGFVVVSAAFIPFGDPEDRPPGVFLRIVVILGSILVVSVMLLCEQFVKKRCR